MNWKVRRNTQENFIPNINWQLNNISNIPSIQYRWELRRGASSIILLARTSMRGLSPQLCMLHWWLRIVPYLNKQLKRTKQWCSITWDFNVPVAYLTLIITYHYMFLRHFEFLISMVMLSLRRFLKAFRSESSWRHSRRYDKLRMRIWTLWVNVCDDLCGLSDDVETY